MENINQKQKNRKKHSKLNAKRKLTMPECVPKYALEMFFTLLYVLIPNYKFKVCQCTTKHHLKIDTLNIFKKIYEKLHFELTKIFMKKMF